jgi:hypothetical protein
VNAFKKTAAEVLPKFHPLFAGFVWAAAARSDDETRFTLTHVLVERDTENEMIHRIVATDGRRLHVHTYDAGLFDDDISDQMLEPGLWEVVAKSAKHIIVTRCEDEDMQYPNWRSVATDHEPQHSAALNAQTVGIVAAKTRVLLAVDFLRQACGFGCGAKLETVHVQFGSEDPKAAMVIEHELGRAYVMPIKWENEAEDEKAATSSFPQLHIVISSTPRRRGDRNPNRRARTYLAHESDQTSELQ